MLSGEQTYTCRSITTLLEREGFTHGTAEFSEQVRLRFIPTDSQDERGSTLYIENGDFFDSVKQAVNGATHV